MMTRKLSRNERFVTAIEEVILWKEISIEEYNFLKSYVASVLWNSWLKWRINYSDVTNELLLRLREKKDTYRFTDNVYWRRKYILYYLLYSLNDIVALTWYWVDIPQRMLKDINIDKSTLCVRLESVEETPTTWEYKDELNVEMENNFLLNLLLTDVSDKEKDIIIKHYFNWLTQQEIADTYKVSQQSIAKAIGKIKSRFQNNCNTEQDSYL